MSSAARGMGVMVLSSLLLTASESTVSLMENMHLPSLTLTGICFGIDFCFVLTWILAKGVQPPQPKEWKYVFGASLLMTLAVGSLLLAVKLGTPIGDISALASINVVLAAFFGRFFLGEKLHSVHFVAAGCSIVGALLISKPSFIFGGGPDAGDKPLAWIGYVFAPLSGFFDACILVFSRRAPDAPAVYTATLYYCQICAFLAILPLTPLIESESLDVLMVDPGITMGWVAVFCALDMPAMWMFMYAAKICPAAVSATIDIGTRMVSGYFVQVVFFGGKLQVMTITGAALMLVGVAAMACVRQPEQTELSLEQDALENTNQQPVKDEENADSQPSGEDVATSTVVASSTSDQDEVESVASFGSFVASEFIGVESQRSKSIRNGEVSGQSLRFRLSKLFSKSQEQQLSSSVGPTARTVGALVSSTTVAAIS